MVFSTNYFAVGDQHALSADHMLNVEFHLVGAQHIDPWSSWSSMLGHRLHKHVIPCHLHASTKRIHKVQWHVLVVCNLGVLVTLPMHKWEFWHSTDAKLPHKSVLINCFSDGVDSCCLSTIGPRSTTGQRFYLWPQRCHRQHPGH